MKVILAGGGTSGHIHPAVAIADELKKQDPSSEVLICGTER
ncbi:MAG: glycosyltransferase [Clostridiales bacterium]|nr:glycosyltransferase [Clostridiales bacterium]